MLSTTSPVTAPPKISVILAAGQPSSCRPTTDRGCKRPFKEPPLTAESGGATRAALLAMRAHRGTGSSNPLPSSGESANSRFLDAGPTDYPVPTTAEIPSIEIHHLQTRTGASGTGAKGVGEGGTVGSAAAVLNAVSDTLAPSV